MIQILSYTYAKQCCELHRLCFDKPWSHKEFCDFFNNDLSLTFGAWDTDNLVGLLSMIQLGTEAEIYTLCVNPNYRHKNIATQLIRIAQQTTKDRLITDIFLEVSVHNYAAIKCYEKNNFKTVTIRKNYYTVDTLLVDAYLMRFENR